MTGVELVGDGLIRWQGMLWSERTARKPGVCRLTGQPFDKGARVYAPITNSRFRMHRILAAQVKP